MKYVLGSTFSTQCEFHVTPATEAFRCQKTFVRGKEEIRTRNIVMPITNGGTGINVGNKQKRKREGTKE